jgi:hypothetical protein
LASPIRPIAERIARVTFSRAFSVAEPIGRSRPPSPNGPAELGDQRIDLGLRARRGGDVTGFVGGIELGAQLREPLAVGGLGLRVEPGPGVAELMAPWVVPFHQGDQVQRAVPGRGVSRAH